MWRAPADGPDRRAHWFAGVPVRVFKNRPRGPAGCVLRRTAGRLLRWVAGKGDEALLSAPQGTVPPARSAKLPNRGVREMPKPAQVATRTPADAKDRSAADAVEPNRKPVTTLDCVLQTAMVRWAEAATARQFSVSQLKLSVIPGERTHR